MEYDLNANGEPVVWQVYDWGDPHGPFVNEALAKEQADRLRQEARADGWTKPKIEVVALRVETTPFRRPVT